MLGNTLSPAVHDNNILLVEIKFLTSYWHIPAYRTSSRINELELSPIELVCKMIGDFITLVRISVFKT